MITMNVTPSPAAVASSSPLSPPPPPLHHPPPPPPPPEAAAAVKSRAQEREALRHVIAQWNANRLDLFELSEPNEDLEFHGVMRFYFQDSGQKVATKCIRVASSAPATAVVETLIEKFRPDMRMLSVPEYALYEIHENGDERRLSEDEKPLLVQLNWHKDDREGRFLLRRIDDKTNVPAVSFQEGGSSFCRKLSKREKKQLKKQEKLNKLKGSGGIMSIGNGATSNGANENDGGVAEKLYTELPETSFTRSISNPEAVMRRRRQQKLERKLQQFRSKDGGPDTGGTLKIYGESLCRDVPYKTLLLSVRDTAAVVVREMLSKYGLTREDPSQYCLIQVNVLGPDNGGESSKEYHGSTNREYILDDDECPLAILMNHPSSRGSIMFHVRRRPADYHPRKRKKKPQQHVGGQKGGSKGGGGEGSSSDPLEYRRYEDSYDRLPYLLELNPDGSDIVNGIPKRHRLQLNVTEVGSERSSQGIGVGTGGSVGGGSQSLQLFGPNVQPRHCVVAHTEGIVTVTPCSRDAETYVNGQRIYETTILQNGAVVKFGRIHNFRFLDPSFEDRISRHRHDSSRQGHDYSDRQSNKDESVLHGGSMSGVSASQGNFETTFDVDGHVETVSSASSSKLQQQQDPDSRSQRSVGSREGNRSSSNYERYPPPQMQQPLSTQRPPTGSSGGDPILPAALEFREEATDTLLDALVSSLDPSAAPPHFRLAPTYAIYLAARFRASTHYRPELTPTERAHRLTALLARVAAMIRSVVQERYEDAESLAFWMANASELLHFLKSDRHISAFSLDAQDILAEAVQIAFRNLVSCLQADLGVVMPHFLADRDDDRNEEESAGSVLQVLASAMALLRRCRVNAALTIQLFSQLFHYVNVWTFNRIVASAIASGSANSPTSSLIHTHHHHPHVHQHHHRPSYCSREWGIRLGARLARVEAWAERQGLELAADCHLSRIAQAAHLLQAPKYNAEELCAISTACFKLNSLQLRALLTNYQHGPDEPRIPMELVENVIRVAENVCDDLIRNEGREVRLEEEEGELLRLPFLLPDDGYSCDVVRGLPPGLVELLTPLQRANICRLVPQHSSAGFWTVYMTPPPNSISQQSIEGHHHSQSTNIPPHGPRSPSAMSNRSGGMESSSSRLQSSVVGHLQSQMTSTQHQQHEPETQVIKLHKSNNGMGLSIVAAKGAGQDRLGIYIKSVVKGGAADADGRLQAGDQLLKVDGQSLVGITQEKAAEYLVRTGPVVSLEVAKQGAIYHGLATLLSQPSPVMSRAHRPYSVHQDIVGSRGRTGNDNGNVTVKHLNYIPSSLSLPQLAQSKPSLRNQQKPRNSVHALRDRSGDWNNFSSSVSVLSEPVMPCPVMLSPMSPCLVQPQACVSGEPLSSLKCLPGKDEEVKMHGKNESTSPTCMLPNENLDMHGVKNYGNLIQERSVLSVSPSGIHNICARCHCYSAGIGKLGTNDSLLREVSFGKNMTAITTEHGTNTEEKDFLGDCSDGANGSSWLNAECWEIGDRCGRNPEYSTSPKFLTNGKDSVRCTIKIHDLSEGALPENNSNSDDNFTSSTELVETVSSDDSTSVTFISDEKVKGAKMNDERNKSDGIIHKSDGYQTKDGETGLARDGGSGGTKVNSMEKVEMNGTCNKNSHSDASQSWCFPGDISIGNGRVAALARHFASLLPDRNRSGICCIGSKEKGCFRNVSLSKSMPDMSRIECKIGEEEEEEHGECGWKTHILSNENNREDDVTEEIGYCLLYAAMSSGRKGKALPLLRGPPSSRPRSEDNLSALDTSKEMSLDAMTSAHLPHPLSWRYEKPRGIRPRRMSERDLPSKVQGEHNQSVGERGRVGALLPPHMPAIHGSKSVPSLSSGHGDVGAMTIGSPQQTASGGISPPGQGGVRQNLQPSQLQQQHQQHHQPTHVHSHHEVYNPGYSRTSSTNSIPQKSSGYEGGLRSRSSQNLSEPRSHSTMAAQGLGTRQASNPGLTGQNQQQPLSQHHQYPTQQHSNVQQQHQHSNSSQQQSGEAERFYQNLCVYRSQQPESQGHNGFTPSSPNRGKLSSPQSHDDRGLQMTSKAALRSSQSSLHRQLETGNGNQGANGARDRPVSAYLPQNGPQPIQAVPRSQSARDVLRQEAKLQEMQEEVRRRREGRPGGQLMGVSGTTSLQQQYQLSHPNSRSHPQLLQQRGPVGYPQNPGYQDGMPHSPNHHHHPNNPQFPIGGYSPYNVQAPIHGPGYPPFPVSPGQYPQNALLQQQSGPRNPPPTAPKPRPIPNTSTGGSSQRQIVNESIELPPVRPPPPEDVYRDSPPPPPPPTSTHPLYQSGTVSPAQKQAVGPSQHSESRYNASAGEPPKGSFYPPTSSALTGPRHFPFSGTNPWDREEKEKEQAKRREAARLWRDRQISELEALGPGGRGPGQEERLRALRLEREFQRRAEEEEARRGKRGGGEEDDEEEEEEDEEGGGEGMEEGRRGDEEAKMEDGVEQDNGNEGEERNGNIEDLHDAKPVGGLLRMVANAEETDCHPSRKSLEISNGSSHCSQIMNQQVMNLSQPPFGHPNKSVQPGPLRLDNLVVNGGSSAMGGESPLGCSPRSNTHHSLHNYQDGIPSTGPYSPTAQAGVVSQHGGSGSQRLDSLLSLGPTSPAMSTGVSIGLSQVAPTPPERGSSFVVMSQQQQQQVHPGGNTGGVLRNANSGSGTSHSSSNLLSVSSGITSTATTTKRVSFHDSKVVTFDDNANHQERCSVREDPNNFINEAQTMLSTPRSPDGSFAGNTPGVIGAQEVYRDPRTRRLAEQQKLLVNRTGPLPEKLSFKEKMKMFAMETGEDGTPKDKVKISRAQRDIEGPIPPNGYGPN